MVCPAGLQDQWADELREKAGPDFEIYDSARLLEIKQQLHLGRNPWAARRRIIASVDHVKRPDVKRMLRDITWELVIVDEAHYLSETSVRDRIYRTERSRFGQFVAKQADNLVLLTATPHTGDPRSLWSLIDLAAHHPGIALLSAIGTRTDRGRIVSPVPEAVSARPALLRSGEPTR